MMILNARGIFHVGTGRKFCEQLDTACIADFKGCEILIFVIG